MKLGTLPFLKRMRSAARREQLARRPAPATQAMPAARASGGSSGSGAGWADMASVVGSPGTYRDQ